MRVLFWSETFWPRVGGVENLAAKLLPPLRARGHEFAVVTWEDTAFADKIFYQDIPVYRFPFFSSHNQYSIKEVMECRRQVGDLKRCFAPDLVHINSYGQSVLFHLNTINAHPAPVLLTLHQPLPDEPIQRDSLLGHLLRSSHWVNTCSKAVLAQAQRLAPEIILSSSVIYNALEVPNFEPQPLTFDPPRLLCVGRLVPEKGFDKALSAFATVVERFPHARLIIAGDGPERETLTKQVRDLRLADSVKFLGNISPEMVFRQMNKATLVVVPSQIEGFGLVALEAALMARPVVAMRVGGLSEVVLHEETGLLVEHDKPGGIAEAVLFLLSQPKIAPMFGAAAQRRAHEVFSFDGYVDGYDDLYHRVAGKLPPADTVSL